ncbi:adenylate/guanylate cyclase domain-containing protein [Desulfosarcina widdelii]|nr:adenylate/guanylate cyclase domain-containing protein [Desulfosarcina widdelii]
MNWPIKKENSNREDSHALALAEMIIQNSPSILFRRLAADDPKQRKMVYVSPNISRFGYRAEDFLNDTIMFRDIVYQGDKEKILQEIKDFVAKERENYTQVYRIVTNDGELRWVEDQTSIYVDPESDIRYHQGIVTDIHERMIAEEKLRKEQEKVQKACRIVSKYVPPQIAETISHGPIDLVWKHHRKKLTLFFSDIKNFTKITDSLEPEDMGNLLNEYLSEMIIIINRYGGTLAQLIGDGLYVIFGAPNKTEDKDHAVRCLHMAIDMQLKMEVLNQKWFDSGIDENLKIRCGINTGMATVGGYGSSERKEYTAMGMQVNLAARLESACKPGRILISHTTWALAREEFPCTPLGKIEVKGYHRPISVYELDPFHVQFKNHDSGESVG